MFDVAVYTDVRAEEALDGIAGFNFMAASPGVTGADQKFVTQRMLHVVKSSWHVDHKDELAHPPSCIYRKSDGRYFLSRGRSIGQTVTAPRPGNQLTQTIMTSEPEDFVPYRPAQLYAASQWNLSRGTAGKQLSPWPTPLEIDGAFEPDSLKEALVDRSPFGDAFLPCFLTMVEQAVGDPGKKLVIVHTELDVVMRHIALASLFLDINRALATSFVAFADQPLAAVADIVGATPDFGDTPKAHAGGSAFNVVDLLAAEMSPVDVSPSAARQAEWFMGDPLDALVAIDLARRWESALGADVATDAAGIVSFTDHAVATPQDRTAALRAVCGLVANGLGDDLAMYTDELLDAVVTSPPASDADVALAADAVGASHGAELDEVGAGILLPTLEVLAARPDLLAPWSTAVRRWQPGAAPLLWASQESLGHALQAQAQIVNCAPTEHLVDILVAGKITNLLPDDIVVAPALDRLADYWCQHPELAARKHDLPYQASLGSRLTARLVNALEHHHRPVMEAFTAGAWDWLIGSGSVLAPWQSAAALGSVAPERRAAEIATCGVGLPPNSWRLALAGIAIPAGSAAVAEWINTHPTLPADLGAWIFETLRSSQSNYEHAASARAMVSALLDQATTTPDPDLTRLIGEAAHIRRLYRDAKRASTERENLALRDFAARVAPYVGFFGPEVGSLLVKAQDRRGSQRLEHTAGQWAARLIEDTLEDIARHSGDVGAVEWALSLYESGTQIQSDAATDFLLNLADSRAGRHRLDDVRDGLAPSWAPVLDKLIEESKKGRLTRNVMRGGKRLFNKER